MLENLWCDEVTRYTNRSYKMHLWRDNGMLTIFAAATATNGTNLWTSGGALYNHHTNTLNILMIIFRIYVGLLEVNRSTKKPLELVQVIYLTGRKAHYHTQPTNTVKSLKTMLSPLPVLTIITIYLFIIKRRARCDTFWLLQWHAAESVLHIKLEEVEVKHTKINEDWKLWKVPKFKNAVRMSTMHWNVCYC